MTDSPMVRIPLDPVEQPILDTLLNIRTQLELMKQDKTCFVKSDDVVRLYQETLEQVDKLNGIRTNKRDEQNRVDTVLDDCFQLISLGFMVIGRCSELPAIYSIVSVIKRLLDHLKEAAFYSPKDLDHAQHRLRTFRETISNNRGSHDPHLVTLLEARLDICEATLAELKEPISHLGPDLLPAYEKLVSIIRSLSAANVRSTFPKAEVDDITAQLKQLQREFGESDPPGPIDEAIERYAIYLKDVTDNAQKDPRLLVTELLGRCVLWASIIEQRHGRIGEGFKGKFAELLSIRNSLESKSLLQAWSMRETDLYSYHRALNRIDDTRGTDGNFYDDLGQPADLQTQRTLLYLLRKSYALIYFLLTESKPVSEALLPIYNQLKTLRKCLREVQKAGGVGSSRELYPYKMKLNSVDKIRVDGKFMVNNAIPEGQATVMQLMEECYEIMHDLQADADAEESEARPEAQPEVVQPAPQAV